MKRYPKHVRRLIKAHFVVCTKCPECGRKSHWSNPYDINQKHICWGCNKKVKMIEISNEEFWGKELPKMNYREYCEVLQINKIFIKHMHEIEDALVTLYMHYEKDVHVEGGKRLYDVIRFAMGRVCYKQYLKTKKKIRLFRKWM